MSYFLLDMSSPGIDIRPLRELTGEALFNEVFLDDVFVPDDMLVAGPGDGWKLARTTLANERVVAVAADSSLGAGGEALLAAAQGGRPLDGDRSPMLGKILCDAQSLGLFGLRTALRQIAGGQPGRRVERRQAARRRPHPGGVGDGDGVAGRGRVVRRGRPGTPPRWWFLNGRCLSIAGGTTDVQLNIIGERILGLPRDPEPTPKG